MPELTVGLWIVYSTVAFGVRVLVQLRATGRTGLVSFRNMASGLERWAGGLFVLGLVGGFASAVLPAVGWDNGFVRVWHVSEPVTWLGAVLYLAGLVATFVAQLAMGRSWRIGVDASERTELIERGPFRLVRNPIFTCLLLTAAGLAAMCNSWLAWSSVACLLLALELQVRGVEEPYLVRVHGDAYREYAAGVGRFWPGVGRGV